VLISRTSSLTQTHTLFLEWHALKQIREASRFADDNGNAGSRPHTPTPLEAECLESFETGHTLISSLGFPLFDPVAAPATTTKEAELLLLRSPGTGVDGRGYYTPEVFVVLAGSVGRLASTPSLPESRRIWPQQLIDRGVLAPNGNGALVFRRDHLFKAPTGGAIALMGRNANGWTEWTNAAGLTLHQLQREPQTMPAPAE
jgi:hypothetical protein